MKTFLIALPPDWEKRLQEALARRGRSSVVWKRFDGEGEILQDDDPAMVLIHADGSPEEALGFCRRLRDRRPAAKLQILACAAAPPDKRHWPSFQRAGVNFILPAAFTDSELEFRLAIAECLLESTSPTGGVAPSPGREIDFAPATENVPYGVFHSSLDNKFLEVNDGMAHILDYSSKEKLLQAEESLRKREAQFRGLFENLPDFVLLLDQNASIRFVNHGAPGVDAEALIGATGFAFLQESYQPRCRKAFATALASNAAQNVEAIDIFGNHWSCRIVPVVWEGTLDHVMVICTDITAQKHAAEVVLDEQKLLRRLIDLQERERRFLSYEIHDGFAQQITAALFHLEAFKRLREGDRPAAEKNLDQAAALLSRSIDETRRLISGLRPPILDESGILAAVEYLICENRERSGIDIMFTHKLREIRLAPPLESAVFRIIQESLTNACRHSRGDFIRVELHESEDRLQIVVFDEGVGFDPAAVAKDRFGLRSIRERARLLGGLVEIQTSPGEGCRIRVELPLVPAAEFGS